MVTFVFSCIATKVLWIVKRSPEYLKLGNAIIVLHYASLKNVPNNEKNYLKVLIHQFNGEQIITYQEQKILNVPVNCVST